MTAEPTNIYDESQITVLEGLDAVKKRPGMYIGSTGMKGLHHLIWEIADNAIDEAMAGRASSVDVVLYPDGSVSVADDGAGIPVGKHKQTGISTLTTVLTVLHAGGKFGDSGYKVSGGLHGVGISVVNALSEKVIVTVKRDGATWTQEFKEGIPVTKGPKKGRKTSKTGTRVRFWASDAVFEKVEFDRDFIQRRLKQMAFLNKGLKISLKDERFEEDPLFEIYQFKGGVTDFVEDMISGQTAILKKPMYAQGVARIGDVDISVEVAVTWTNSYSDDVRSFVNTIATGDGGTHEEGFSRSMTRVMNAAARDGKILKDKDKNFRGDDIREGMACVISVLMPDPQFEGQTKGKLGSSIARTAVEQIVGESLNIWVGKHKTEARKVLKKISGASKAREAARTAREVARKASALEGSSLPGKLADCRTRDVSKSELIIVEGDSAMGCFTGETLVALVGEPAMSLHDLMLDCDNEITHRGYASDSAGNIVTVELQNPRITKTVKTLLIVELDTGDILECTPDHLFLLRNGTWLRADCLTRESSLMPLYRKTSETKAITAPKEMVWHNSLQRWTGTHRLDSDSTLLAKKQKISTKIRPVANAEQWNHGIKNVTKTTRETEVYDLTVDNYHNFALDSGVFVHNSGKRARDSSFQALLPIRGKILNTYSASLKRMLDNNECAAIVTAIGAGVGADFSLDQMRYNRVVILTDADVDGSHIRILLLTLFWRYMRPMLEEGRVYAAQPPLYKITTKGKNPEIFYAYGETDRIEIIGNLEKEGRAVGHISRYKGLGEMPAEELATTVMDPHKRILRRIDIADAAEASELFNIFMGTNSLARKEYIAANAHEYDLYESGTL